MAWNAQEEMKKRREKAQSQGKGNYDANKTMADRKKAAQAKRIDGKRGWNAEDYMADRVSNRLEAHENGSNKFSSEKEYERVKKMYEQKLTRG